MHAEEARRTWWLVYVQEVELSLDSGRPMWFPTSDVEIEFPSVEVSVHVTKHGTSMLTTLAAPPRELVRRQVTSSVHPLPGRSRQDRICSPEAGE